MSGEVDIVSGGVEWWRNLVEWRDDLTNEYEVNTLLF